MAKDHVLGLVDTIEGGMKGEIEEALKEEETKKVKIKTL